MLIDYNYIFKRFEFYSGPFSMIKFYQSNILPLSIVININFVTFVFYYRFRLSIVTAICISSSKIISLIL